MSKTPRIAALALVAIVTTTVATVPAQASRRSALAGNLLVEDVKDIFFLPHDVARYVNYVWFDFLTGISNPLGIGPGAGDPALGSGGILFGNANTNDFGFGVATHRADHQGALRNAFLGFGDVFQLNANQGEEDGESLFDDFGLDTLQWLDLLAGFSLSSTFDLGARVSVGSNLVSREDREGDDAGVPNPSTSVTSFNVLVSGGYDKPGGAVNLDFAAELSIASYTREQLAGGDEVADDGSSLGFGLAGRGFFELGTNIDLGVLAGLEIRNKSVEGDGVLDNEASELGVIVGAGPVYTIGGGEGGTEAIISAYVTLGVQQRTEDPEGSNNLTDAVSWLLPGVRISAEWWLTEWFAYRAGLASEYRLISGEQQEDDATGGSDLAARDILFYWSNGIGFEGLDGDFHFDAVINWPLVTDGPYIFSGVSNGMFAMATAAYSF